MQPFNPRELSLDPVRETLRFASDEEIRNIAPKLSQAQIEYVLATLPVTKANVVRSCISPNPKKLN